MYAVTHVSLLLLLSLAPLRCPPAQVIDLKRISPIDDNSKFFAIVFMATVSAADKCLNGLNKFKVFDHTLRVTKVGLMPVLHSLFFTACCCTSEHWCRMWASVHMSPYRLGFLLLWINISFENIVTSLPYTVADPGSCRGDGAPWDCKAHQRGSGTTCIAK